MVKTWRSSRTSRSASRGWRSSPTCELGVDEEEARARHLVNGGAEGARASHGPSRARCALAQRRRPVEVSIVEERRCVFLCSDAGRCTRPLWVLRARLPEVATTAVETDLWPRLAAGASSI